jgi:hypothetical protein
MKRRSCGWTPEFEPGSRGLPCVVNGSVLEVLISKPLPHKVPTHELCRHRPRQAECRTDGSRQTADGFDDATFRCRIRHLLANYNADRKDLFALDGEAWLNNTFLAAPEFFAGAIWV